MFMSLCSSLMYHTCETFSTDIFIEELQWYRMENTFVISSFSTYLLYLSGTDFWFNSDCWHNFLGKVPVEHQLFCSFHDLLLSIYSINNHRVIYNWNYFGISLALTTVGVHFFAKGLDEFDDYLRFNHSFWHLVIGLSSWYGFQSTRIEPIQRKSDKIK